MEPPEIVFVGKKGSGKTALIDALLGSVFSQPGNVIMLYEKKTRTKKTTGRQG